MNFGRENLHTGGHIDVVHVSVCYASLIPLEGNQGFFILGHVVVGQATVPRHDHGHSLGDCIINCHCIHSMGDSNIEEIMTIAYFYL